MPCRMVKTFYKELGHRMHREHRSKRGRTENYELKKTIRQKKALVQRKDDRYKRIGLKKICGRSWDSDND